MRFGLYLPPFGELADPWVVSDLAVRAEASGFDGFFIWDHILRPQQGLPVADPWVTLAAVAVRTKSIRLGALVTPLTRRRPQKFARETMSLDRLSGGRLVVGVGLGVDSGGELTRFGEAADEGVRADRLDEALDLVRELWSGQVVHHRGPHFVAEEVQFLPTPVQGDIPVWVAARRPVPRAMRRAARCQGLCPLTSPEGLGEMLAKVKGERGSLDGFDVVVQDGPGSKPEPWEAAGATWWLTNFPVGAPGSDVEAFIASGPPGA